MFRRHRRGFVQTFFRDDEQSAIFGGEHGVGGGIAHERFGRRIDVQLAAESIGDVAEMAIRAGDVTLLDVGVKLLGVAQT